MVLCYYVAGCISGVTAFLISYPLDTIKTQQQFRNLRYMEAVRRIKNYRGWRGFYRGAGVPLVANAVLNSVFFGLYGDIRHSMVESRLHKAGWYWALSSKIYQAPFHPHHKPLLFNVDTDKESNEEEATFSEFFISGTISGFCLLTVSTPIELVKTKLQSQMKRKVFKGPHDCFNAIYKDAGIKGLYRGIVPMTIRNVASAGIKFTFMCTVLKVCEPDLFPVADSYQAWEALGIAGLIGWMVSLPFDTIKTRMQADDHRKPQFKGMLQATKEILKTDGVSGLYRGFWNVSIRTLPLNALTYMVFDTTHRYLCTHKPMKPAHM